MSAKEAIPITNENIITPVPNDQLQPQLLSISLAWQNNPKNLFFGLVKFSCCAFS